MSRIWSGCGRRGPLPAGRRGRPARPRGQAVSCGSTLMPRSASRSARRRTRRPRGRRRSASTRCWRSPTGPRWPVIKGVMTLSSMRRRIPRIFIAGLLALLFVVPSTPAHAGVDTWTPARLYGGNVLSLATSPADPSVVLAGSAGAGVFRSADGGLSWHRSSSGLPHDTAVNAFAFAPSAPDTVFAATYARGVYRSTDAGRSWVRMTSSIDYGTFTYIAVDPYNAARVFIVGGAAMLRSTDGGTTWAYMDYQAVPEAASVWVDPGDADHILVGGLDGVYRSTDGGASFQPVATLSANDVATTLVADPGVPHRFWAGTRSAGVFRSDDDGVPWHRDS